MEPYVSFPNDAILGGEAPLEGFLEDHQETTPSRSAQPASANPPIGEAVTWRKQAPVVGPLEELSTSPDT